MDWAFLFWLIAILWALWVTLVCLVVTHGVPIRTQAILRKHEEQLEKLEKQKEQK